MKNFCEQIFRVLLPLLFTFPLFKENISSFLFILLAINTSCYCIAIKKIIITRTGIMLTIPFWIILITTLLHSINNIVNFNVLNTALFFLLFPLLFYNIPANLFNKKSINFYLNILSGCCTIIIFGYFIMFLYKYDYSDFFVYKYNIPKFRDFVYNESPIFKIHPTYFTSILFICTAYMLNRAVTQRYYIGYILSFLYFFMTFMLLTKLNIVLMLALLFIIIIFRTGISIKYKLAGTAVSIGLAISLILLVPGIKHRFKEIYTSYNRPPIGLAFDSTNIRVAISKCTIEGLKENYLLGVGFDNVKTTLYNCFEVNYSATNFYTDKNYLTHNYYFYILLSAGILGFAVFSIYLIKIGVILKSINSFIAYSCLLNIYIVCFTEDFFYRHYGIFYYHLILMTFIMHAQYGLPNREFLSKTHS